MKFNIGFDMGLVLQRYCPESSDSGVFYAGDDSAYDADD